MITKVIYDGEGRIERISTGSAMSFDQLEVNEPNSFTVEVEPNLETDYVVWENGLEVVARPTFPAPSKTSIMADGVDEAVFSFPFEVEIYVDGVYVGTDDNIEISSNHPDVYTVTVNHWPYMPYSVDVIAA